ncbi:MAG TPA: ATP-dependent DNA helicase [Candidatus Dormibacteraeota bacterium]|nr:ATP-dependent DNA helicase [Candidatus Dormibacteraeota bacterium]
MSATRVRGPVLSAEQAAAAHAGPQGAFLIAAGPGTGKTFTATERFCWLVEQGVAPDRILTVTFSDRAAEELRLRITRELGARRPDLGAQAAGRAQGAQLLDGAAGRAQGAQLLDGAAGRAQGAQLLDGAWIGTFHSVCARLLDEFAYLVGAPREMRVLDETGQRLFEQELLAKLRSGAAAPFDPDSFSALSVDDLDDLLRSGLRFLLKLKGRGITPERFRERAVELHAQHWSGRPSTNGSGGPDPSRAEAEAIDVLSTIYSAYEEALHSHGLRDFDDLLLEVIDALERVPEFRRRCRERFRYLIVDEFQDTNRIQLDFIRLAAAEHFGNVTVVGDAKQSIYGWRDAEIENIRSRFPGTSLPLTHNRRSFQGILDCATDFIRRDRDFASEPDLVATRGSGDGPPVSVMMAPDSRTEARSVAETIRRLHVSGRAFRDIAVLSHSVRMLPREFEDELRRQGIPYVTSGGSGFFDRQEIKDVLGLLRLAENPMDDGALVRILQGPIVRLTDAGMYRLASRRFEKPGMRLRDCFDESMREGFPEMEAKVAAEATRLLDLTDRIGRLRDTLTVGDILNRLLEESGYLRWAELRAQRDGSPRALLNLRKVFQLAGRFERDLTLAGIGDFVRHLDQVIDAELPVGEAAEESEGAEAVSLLTIHAAKGLEFPVVFLVNLRPPRPRDTERLFFDPDSLGFVMKNWRGEKHPRYVDTSPGAPAVALAIGERRRIVYVGLTRARDSLYVTATREEPSVHEVGANGVDDHDHFAEILSWAVAHPESAVVVESEQLELPVPRTLNGHVRDDPSVISAVLDRLEEIGLANAAATPERAAAIELSFSQLHDFEVCPVRYRFSQVWGVPAPPDELQPFQVRAIGSTELGSAVHEALAAWHMGGGDLLELYRGPALGREMLARYLEHPLSRARTLAVEAGFNMSIAGARVRGLVDRICESEGRSVLIDFKTNATLDEALLEAYRLQLRIYGVAAHRGLLAGGTEPRLVLFDLRHAQPHDVTPDDELVHGHVATAARLIAAGDFRLGPEHEKRPCQLCAYRPICPDARKVL